MKKLLLGFAFLLMQVTLAMEVSSTSTESQKVWRDKFNGLEKRSYNDVVGYDLKLTLRPDDRPEITHKTPSLLAHGWGSSPVGVIECARFVGPHRIPGDAFTFYFPDGNDSIFNPFFILDSSLGQERDIKSLLIALKAMLDCGLEETGCNLFGQSRGGGAVVNTLTVLNTKKNSWPQKLSTIKDFFKDGVRQKILTMIKKGVVVLDTPIVTTQAGLNARFPHMFRGILCNFIDKCMLPVITRGNYNPTGPQALKSADNLPEGLKILLSYQNADVSVGNEHDQEFAQKLLNCLGKEGSLHLVLGADGGKQICSNTWRALQAAAQNGTIIARSFVIQSIPAASAWTLPAHLAGQITLLESGILNKFYAENGGSFNKADHRISKEMLQRYVCEQGSLSLLNFYGQANNNVPYTWKECVYIGTIAVGACISFMTLVFGLSLWQKANSH